MVYLAAVLAFASAALASPLSIRQETPSEPTIPADWTWQVENWHAGCARAGCNYNFNITVPTIPNQIGGVKAYCTGYEIMNENFFSNCRILEGVNNGVSAKFGDREGDMSRGPAKIYFSFLKAPYEPLQSPGYNYTGEHAAVYNAFVSPLLNFSVTPTEVVEVEV